MTIFNINKKRAVYSLLTFLTLSSPIGHFFHSAHLTKVGLATLASPLMIVYSELSNTQVMKFEYLITVTNEDKTSEKIILNKKLYNEIASKENRFNRHIMILPYMTGTFLIAGDKSNLSKREKALQYGLCHNGPYAKYLNLRAKIDSVNIKIFTNNTKEEIFNEYTLHC